MLCRLEAEGQSQPGSQHLPPPFQADLRDLLRTQACSYVSGWALINDLSNFLVVQQKHFSSEVLPGARGLTPCSYNGQGTFRP